MTLAVIRPGKHPVIRPGENTGEAARQAVRAAGFADAAAESAAFAEEFSGPAYATVEAGEAATTEGQFFRVPIADTDPVEYTRYQRTADGSVEAAPLATTAALASTDTGKGAEMVAYRADIPDAVEQPAAQKLGEVKSVMDTGADPASRYVSEDDPEALPVGADSTAEFRKAARSAATYARLPDIEKTVYVTTGRYRLDGDLDPVNIRKGSNLVGDGHGSYLDGSKNGPNTRVVLGTGDTGQDPGGSPSGISGFRTFGGSAIGNPFILAPNNGFRIANLFMTSPGKGIGIIGASSAAPATDGIVSDIEIDQAGQAFQIGKAQNLTINNVCTYETDTVFYIDSDTRDMVVSNVLAAYAEQVVYFSDSSDRIRNLVFGNVALTMSDQLAGFTAFVFSRASNVQALFHGFSAANYPGYAFRQDAGLSNDLSLVAGVLSGDRSTTEYTQGSSSKGLSTGYLGTYLVEGVSFLNLRGEAFKINSTLNKLTVRGGRRVLDGDALTQLQAMPESNAAEIKAKYGALTGLLVDTAERLVRISIKGMDGFGYATATSTHKMFILPFWGFNTEYRVHVRGNLSKSGNEIYGGWENFILSVRSFFTAGALTQIVEKVGVLKPTSADTAPPDIVADVCFGIAPGGATSRTGAAVVATGFICISVAGTSTDAGDFEWSAETLL